MFEFDRLDDCNFFFLFEHDDEKSIIDVKSEYGSIAEKIDYCQFMTVNSFKKYMNDNNIDFIFINGQRIADDRVVLAAKELNIKSYMLQHGMYIPFLKRDSSFFLKKIKKSFSYLFYALNVSIHVNNYSLLFKYVMVYVFGRNQIEMNINRNYFNVDKVFVYSKYWKDFHSKQFGYSEKSQLIVGTPDLRNLNEFLSSISKRDEVCYIAQTLVEDGRLEKEVQQRFFSLLSKVTHDMGLGLVVKLHPRSDFSLFPREGYTHISFVNDLLPSSYFFIGHYSTLLAKPMIKNDIKTIIYEYEGHPTPEYFKMCASCVISESDDLRKAFCVDTSKSEFNICDFFALGDNYARKVIDFVLEDNKTEESNL